MKTTREMQNEALKDAYVPREFPAGPKQLRASTFDCALQWPRVGGDELEVGATSLFRSDEFRKKFKPGKQRHVYIAACPALAEDASRAGLPLYKPGVTGQDRVGDRIRELRRDQYAAWRFIDGAWQRLPGFRDWFASHIYPCELASPASPVVAETRSIRVTLPDTLSTTAFDAAFDAATRLGAIDLWSTTAEARAHCAARGIEPTQLQFATHYPDNSFEPAREICCLTLYAGADRLVCIAEQIIAQHLGLHWTKFDAD